MGRRCIACLKVQPLSRDALRQARQVGGDDMPQAGVATHRLRVGQQHDRAAVRRQLDGAWRDRLGDAVGGRSGQCLALKPQALAIAAGTDLPGTGRKRGRQRMCRRPVADRRARIDVVVQVDPPGDRAGRGGVDGDCALRPAESCRWRQARAPPVRRSRRAGRCCGCPVRAARRSRPPRPAMRARRGGSRRVRARRRATRPDGPWPPAMPLETRRDGGTGDRDAYRNVELQRWSAQREFQHRSVAGIADQPVGQSHLVGIERTGTGDAEMTPTAAAQVLHGGHRPG